MSELTNAKNKIAVNITVQDRARAGTLNFVFFEFPNKAAYLIHSVGEKSLLQPAP
jgi:hypothetical protein